MGAKTFLQFPFVGGLDQKTDPAYLDPNARLASVVNGNFLKVNAVDKRMGMANLSNAVVAPGALPSPTTGQRVCSWTRSNLTVMGSSNLYTFSQAEGELAAVSKLPTPYSLRRPVNVGATFVPPVVVDMPYNGRTLRIAISQDATFNVDATVYDADSGDVFLEPTQILANAGLAYQVIVQAMYLPNATAGQQLAILVEDNTGTHRLNLINYNPATNSFSSPNVILSGVNAYYDACPYVGDPQGGFLLAYYGSGTSLVLQYVLSNGTLSSSRTVTIAGAPAYPLSVVGTYGEQVWVAFNQTAGPYYAQFSGDYTFTLAFGSVQTLITGIVTTATRLTGSAVLFTFQTPVNPGGSNGVNTTQGTWRVFLNNGSEQGQPGTMPIGFVQVARPFVVNGVPYQATVYCNQVQASSTITANVSQQITMYLLQWQTTNASGPSSVSVLPVATIAKNIVSMQGFFLANVIFSEGHINLMSQTSLTATRFATGLATTGIDTAAVSGNLGPSFTAEFFYDAAHTGTLYQSQELGSELHISGSVPFVCDSKIANEDNFFHYPEWTYAVQGGSGCTLSGVYQYAVCYAFTDAAGLIHRSAPAFTAPFTPVGGGSTGAILHITALSCTWRDVAQPGQVVAEVYRTVANGTIFYLVDRIPCSNTNTSAEVIWPSSGCDNTPDTTVQLATNLYTTGSPVGPTPNINPPSFAIQISHNGRIMGLDETLQQVWPCQQITPGTAPGYSGLLVLPFYEGGDTTAMASMDGKFILFKASSIWIMFGNNGPAITAQNSDWSNPQKIQTNVGAISQFGVVSTDIGVFFQSQNGIYLLGRDQSVQYIGAPVTDTLAAYPTITSATVVPSFNQVRFACSNGTTTTTIVYDYLLREWLTHSYPYVTGPVQSSCLTAQFPQQFTMIDANGYLWQEQLSTASQPWMDEDTSGVFHFVPTSVTGPWVKSGLQGYMRALFAQLFAELQSGVNACGLEMQVAIDYNPSIVDSQVMTAAQLGANASGGAYSGQVELYVGAQWNQAMAHQFTFSDVDGAGVGQSGQGARFIGYGVMLEQLGQRFPFLPPGARQAST